MTETGGFILETILNEGAPLMPRSEIVFEQQMAKNDFVIIDINDLNTFKATGGRPVGKIITTRTGQLIVGKILTVPRFESLEYNPAICNWEDQLSSGHYRVADVIWYGINSIVVAHMQSGVTSPGHTTLVADSIKTDQRTDGKLALRPGDGQETIISFHGGSSGDDILIGIMRDVKIEKFL